MAVRRIDTRSGFSGWRVPSGFGKSQSDGDVSTALRRYGTSSSAIGMPSSCPPRVQVHHDAMLNRTLQLHAYTTCQLCPRMSVPSPGLTPGGGEIDTGAAAHGFAGNLLATGGHGPVL